jgi:hypothetical protein
VDNEDDPIEIEVKDPERQRYLRLVSFSNESFGLKVDRSILTYMDEGWHKY